MLEAIELFVASRVGRSACGFAHLPASGCLGLLLAIGVALLVMNAPFAAIYHAFIGFTFVIGPPGGLLSMTVANWFSKGLLTFFFLLVGLEIRREMTAADLASPRAAILAVIAATGGVLAPALIYLALNDGLAQTGWSVADGGHVVNMQFDQVGKLVRRPIRALTGVSLRSTASSATKGQWRASSRRRAVSRT